MVGFPWLNRAISILQYGGESINLQLILNSEQDLKSRSIQSGDVQRATYSIKKLIFADILPVVVLLVIPFFAHAGFFSAIADFFVDETKAEEVVMSESIDDVPLLRAATNIDPNPAKGGGDVIVEDGALVADTGPLGGSDSEKNETNGEISVYIVREGDSLSQIAVMFDVTANTILWANDIKKDTGIKEGDELIILPITGVRHVVKTGDTLASIAKKYKGVAEDILAYNQLESAENIAVGDTIVIPGGEVEAPVIPKKTIAKGAGGVSISGYFIHPVPGATKTQGIHGYNGVDLAAGAGTAVRAAASGEVIIARASGYNGGYGAYVVVKHPNGTQTLYAHLSSVAVGVGTQVGQGQKVGGVGNTGRSTGTHLHFEVRGARNPF